VGERGGIGAAGTGVTGLAFMPVAAGAKTTQDLSRAAREALERVRPV
jgi:hypothetical protein